MKTDFSRLDRAFNPGCVAVIGDNGRLQWLRNLSVFKGKLYSVQISPESVRAIEALGVKNYPNLLDIPDAVDLAIVAVPRSAALKVLDDCIAKGVAAAHFYTAGFAETDTAEGKGLESQLAAKAKQAGFYIIGPNCMGIFNPAVGLKQGEEQNVGLVGQVGFITQSGTYARDFALEGHLEGVDANKSVSFGNGTVLDSADFLEYFGDDDAIKVIGMYLEGVRDGRRFLSVLRRVSRLKPVVVWKGGRTEEGARATASHTGSLTVRQDTWRAAVRQCGAVSVAGMEEMVDTMKALIYLSPVPGDRVGIAGGSGGQSVAITDAFAENGLAAPPLTRATYDEFAGFFRLIGASYRNPVDIGNANRSQKRRILDILGRDPNLDNLVVLTLSEPGRRQYSSEEIESEISLLAGVKENTSKRMAAIMTFRTPEEMERTRYVAGRLRDYGIPLFVTFERLARALKNALDYEVGRQCGCSGVSESR